MAADPKGFHPLARELSATTCALLLIAIVVLAVALRTAAALVLEQPLESDGLAYFTMAQGLAERGELLDTHGQHAFYSPGYPLVLASFFALLGSSVTVALAVNLLLGAAGVILVHHLALALSNQRPAALIAAAAYALWLPGIWNATTVAKENLSTPLLLGMALCALGVWRGARPAGAAALGGLVWGASLITGGSALLVCSGVVLALLMRWRAGESLRRTTGAALCFAAAAALVLSPWLYATDRMVGRPVLTTNAAFNLYLGNNPAATGKFVSIAETPLAKGWEATRIRLGEIGNADRLRDEALRWIVDNPGRAAGLAALKLAYFWQPNVPDAKDYSQSSRVASIRLFEVAQYMAILLLGLLAFRSPHVPAGGKWIVAAIILGFWLVHAAAYIITRYRDPAVPLLIALGAIPVAAWLRQLGARRVAHAA